MAAYYKRQLLPLAVLVIIAFMAITIFYWSSSQSTNLPILGYIEGRYTYLSSSAAGILQSLNVARGEAVHVGDQLFALEQQPESDQFKQAQQRVKQMLADRAQVQAAIHYSQATLARVRSLSQKNFIDKASLDQAQSTYDADLAHLNDVDAQLRQAQAALLQAQWSQSQKLVVAPVNGIIFDTYYRLGELVPAGKPVVSLLAPENIQAIFFIPETLLGSIHLRDIIKISCDACKPGIKGQISFISPSAEYTPPVIYSSETTSKLVYRVEADLSPVVAKALHPGQPILIYLLKSHG